MTDEQRVRACLWIAATLHARAVAQYDRLVERLLVLGMTGHLADAVVVAHYAMVQTERIALEGLARLDEVRRTAESVQAGLRRLGELEADEAWPENA